VTLDQILRVVKPGTGQCAPDFLRPLSCGYVCVCGCVHASSWHQGIVFRCVYIAHVVIAYHMRLCTVI